MLCSEVMPEHVNSLHGQREVKKKILTYKAPGLAVGVLIKFSASVFLLAFILWWFCW